MTLLQRREPDTGWQLPRPEDIPRDQLLLQLEIYNENIILRRFESEKAWVTNISADALAHTLTQHIKATSGLLPENALWWDRGDAGQNVALWRPPRVWPVALQREAFQPPIRLRLPMPGLVFVCTPGRPPAIYAALERPTDGEQQLYRAPTFNTFSNGRTCPGSHKFPENVAEIPESFFESYFSMTGDSRFRSKKYPENLLDLWEELDGHTEYPTEDLVAQCTVDDIMVEKVRTW